MAIISEIKDGFGSGYKIKVDKEGTIGVVRHGHPPTNDDTITVPFGQFLTDDGTETGSNDMRVAASLASPIPFYIKADQDNDIYIKTISFEIADAGATLSQFGSITALTNGCVLQWRNNGVGNVDLSQPLQSNFDFIRLCGGQPAFGDGVSAFRASNVVGNSEAYIPILDLSKTFGNIYGIRLRKGTTDEFRLLIRDNTTGVDGFNARIFGIKRLL